MNHVHVDYETWALLDNTSLSKKLCMDTRRINKKNWTSTKKNSHRIVDIYLIEIPIKPAKNLSSETENQSEILSTLQTQFIMFRYT